MRRSIDCRRVRELISVCYDGEATHLERAAVQQHVSRCEGCAEFQALVARVEAAQRESIEAVPQPAIRGRELATVVRAGTVPRGSSRRPWFARVALGGSLAAALVLVVIGWWVRVGDGWMASAWTAPTGESRSAVTLALPRVCAPRVLDHGYTPHLGRDYSVLTAVKRNVAGTPDEQWMFFETPISGFDEYHYRPEQL
jgi:predicted anti-sigma-YlaC factor YlaD